MNILSTRVPLSNTPLQRGDRAPDARRNRFNGFNEVWETVETVPGVPTAGYTPLKRGVNEIRSTGGHRALDSLGLERAYES